MNNVRQLTLDEIEQPETKGTRVAESAIKSPMIGIQKKFTENNATLVPLVSTKTPAEDCPSFGRCSAPLCPLDKDSLKNGIWYPGEPICIRHDNKPAWVTIQRRITKKAKDRTRYFIFQDLQRTRVQNPRGHNPNRILPEPTKTAVFTSGEKNKTQG